MSHDYHEGMVNYHPSQILVDGCRECLARSERDDRGISNLDPATFERAWLRAKVWERYGLDSISEVEIPLLTVLASVAAQMDARVGVL